MTDQNKLKTIVESLGNAREVEQFQHYHSTQPKSQFGLVVLPAEMKGALSDCLMQLSLMNQLGIYPILFLPFKTELESAFYFKQNLTEADLKNVVDQKIIANDSPIISSDIPETLTQLIKFLSPKKVIFLNQEGGFFGQDQTLISFLNGFDLDGAAKLLTAAELPLFQKAVGLLQRFAFTSVIVTSPKQLLKEVLTIKGQGTLIKIHPVKTTDGFPEALHVPVKDCLETAFNGTLAPDYFEKAFKQVIYQDKFEGVAIMTALEGAVYLDKFAVKPLFSGTGLGASLFTHVKNKYRHFYWRCRVDSSLANFYFKQADGHIKKDKWIIFWMGEQSDNAAQVIQEILEKEEDFSR